MKNYISIVILFFCGLLFSCSEETVISGTTYCKTFITGYLTPETISVENANSEIKLTFKGQIITSGKTFDELSKYYNDLTYNRNVIYGPRIAVNDSVCKMTIKTVDDFDASHLAGSDISDFIFNNIPVSLDTNNIIKINNYLIDSGVKCISPSIFSYPFNEVYAVINAMKNKGYIFSEDSFPTDFWKEYDSHAKFNMLLKDNYLPDEFLEENGLVRISERRYFNPVMGHFVSANYDNPLPNLKK